MESKRTKLTHDESKEQTQIDEILSDPSFKFIKQRLEQLLVLKNSKTRTLSLARTFEHHTIFENPQAHKSFHNFLLHLPKILAAFQITHLNLSDNNLGMILFGNKNLLMFWFENGLLQVPSLQKLNLSSNQLNCLSLDDLKKIQIELTKSTVTEINISNNDLEIHNKFLRVIQNGKQLHLVKSPKSLLEIVSIFVAKYKLSNSEPNFDKKIQALPQEHQEIIEKQEIILKRFTGLII